jgi:hypothetical protein
MLTVEALHAYDPHLQEKTVLKAFQSHGEQSSPLANWSRNVCTSSVHRACLGLSAQTSVHHVSVNFFAAKHAEQHL